MPVYRSSSKETFIDEVIDFIYNNFTGQWDKVKIIFPNGYLCTHFQQLIIQRFGSSILPKAIPIGHIATEKEEIFKIPAEQLGQITPLAERIIIAEIINSYQPLAYNITESLDLAPSLSNLFFELSINNIEFTTIKNIPAIDQAEHWNVIYSFLEFSFEKWQQKINESHKLTAVQYQRLMLNAELTRVKNSEEITVIAGVVGNNVLVKNFIAEISKLKNGHLILPPYGNSGELLGKSPLAPEHPLYNLDKLLKLLDVENGKIKFLRLPKTTALDKLVSNSLEQEMPYKIEYVEFDNSFSEAEYIAKRSHDLLEAKPDAKIAILITNPAVKGYFVAQLEKYNLGYNDLIGKNILDLPITSLVLELSRNFCQDFSLNNFVSLLLHPLLITKESGLLKKKIIELNRFSIKPEQISELISKYFENNQAVTRFLPLLASYQKIRQQKIIKFNKIFQHILELLDNICFEWWEKSEDNGKFLTAINEILNQNWELKLDNLDRFPLILEKLLKGGQIINSGSGNITVASANETTIINFDLLIYTNFIEDSYPRPVITNPWLNNQIINELGLDTWNARFGNSFFDFYLNLHNREVVITRPIKTSNSALSMQSSFLLKLKHLIGNKLKCSYYNDNFYSIPYSLEEFASSSNFPDRLSATDIETLVRAPYNFYAKKILGLKKENDVEESPKLSEFGNFFHKIVELYTKNYGLSNSASLTQYAKTILSAECIFPEHAKKFWYYKIEALEQEFIEFDRERRSWANQVFSEVKGEMELSLAGKNLTIVAIADRIELLPNNKIIILDYKTGVAPPKTEVYSGLSPQLIIQVLMAKAGAFAVSKTVPRIEMVGYIKVNSRAPFFTLTEIPLSSEMLEMHKEGLINLLTHYIKTGRYPVKQNELKYDDYRHLARRNKI